MFFAVCICVYDNGLQTDFLHVTKLFIVSYFLIFYPVNLSRQMSHSGFPSTDNLDPERSSSLFAFCLLKSDMHHPETSGYIIVTLVVLAWMEWRDTHKTLSSTRPVFASRLKPSVICHFLNLTTLFLCLTLTKRH